MTKEELKNKCTERAKIFQQAMESCKSSNPMDCVEWFADRIAALEKENAELKHQLNKNPCVCNTEWHCNDCLDQLTKAKEILAKWVELFKPKSETALPTPIQVDTEQFLSEVEK